MSTTLDISYGQVKYCINICTQAVQILVADYVDTFFDYPERICITEVRCSDD